MNPKIMNLSDILEAARAGLVSNGYGEAVRLRQIDIECIEDGNGEYFSPVEVVELVREFSTPGNLIFTY